MTKQDLINVVSTKTGSSKKLISDILESSFDSIRETLSTGAKVTLTGFGTFSVSKRSERRGKNPRTGEDIIVPATKTPHFKAGKALKESVR